MQLRPESDTHAHTEKLADITLTWFSKRTILFLTSSFGLTIKSGSVKVSRCFVYCPLTKTGIFHSSSSSLTLSCRSDQHKEYSPTTIQQTAEVQFVKSVQSEPSSPTDPLRISDRVSSERGRLLLSYYWLNTGESFVCLCCVQLHSRSSAGSSRSSDFSITVRSETSPFSLISVQTGCTVWSFSTDKQLITHFHMLKRSSSTVEHQLTCSEERQTFQISQL